MSYKLYDQVQLTDGTQGVIKYIGEIIGKNGTYYGVEMIDQSSSNNTNGTLNNISYFTTTNNAHNGRFIQNDNISSIISPSTHNILLIGSAPSFTVGDTVFVNKTSCNGIVHYVGIPGFTKNPKIFVGIVLEEAKGNCNGTLANCTYFNCKNKYGLYQLPDKLSFAQQDIHVDIDQVDNQDYDNKQNTPQTSDPEPEPEPAPASVPDPVPVPDTVPVVVANPDPDPDPKPQQPDPQLDPVPVVVPVAQPQTDPDPDPVPMIVPVTVAQPKPQPDPKLVHDPQPSSKVVLRNNDDYKISDAPCLGSIKEIDDNGIESTYPTYMTNFCAKVRTHHKLNNYKTINYSSKKYQIDDMLVIKKLDELYKNNANEIGNFIIDNNKQFVYVLSTKINDNNNKQWRAALRVNTEQIDDAKQLINYIQINTNNAIKNVQRISKFNWDKHFQTCVSSIRKSNQ